MNHYGITDSELEKANIITGKIMEELLMHMGSFSELCEKEGYNIAQCRRIVHLCMCKATAIFIGVPEKRICSDYNHALARTAYAISEEAERLNKKWGVEKT